MKKLLASCLPLLLAACASVSTHVVELDPAQKYPPTASAEVLLQKPARPHVEIALIEASGGSEAEMLNDARERAKALGADAIVKTESERLYHAPVAIYDPWPDAFWYAPYRYRHFPPHMYPWGTYRVVGGGYSYLLKVVAIRYTAAPRQ